MIAWNDILAEHGAAVWRVIYRLLNHHADATDCYQETFVAAWRFCQRQKVGDWRSLLLSLATRRAIDLLRKRYQNRLLSLDAQLSSEPQSQDSSPELEAEAGELMDRIRSLMPELPEKQALTFWLCSIEGLAPKQVGERLDISPGEVRVLLHRARTRIRAALGTTTVPEREMP